MDNNNDLCRLRLPLSHLTGNDILIAGPYTCHRNKKKINCFHARPSFWDNLFIGLGDVGGVRKASCPITSTLAGRLYCGTRHDDLATYA